jgi:uncharacterized Ntn-hydrolase superfamily protein
VSFPGIPSTTFTIVGRCQRTGHLGIALSTSALAVSARCPFVRVGVGAVATQAYTDPALGPLALNLVELGFSPRGVIDELRRNDEWFEHRQIGIMTDSGASIVHTGTKNLEWKGHINKASHIAMGNYLAGAQVIEEMSAAFERGHDEMLEERLMRALEAGAAAGGDRGGQLSSGLIVYGQHAYPRTDLRIDLQEQSADDPRDAVAALRDLFNEFKPLVDYYEQKPANPTLGTWREWLATHPM